ncbi:winged helix-turn-helix domain-containing protein [Shewanella sp. Isolate13]|uniref:winged helix-turn-helix domain-containing protein n=1 Tax=Shewanella sp. Isolate13 TaxID=2908531 RepID=UPI001EFCBF31|nr:winged helix-turn-helix domain-containing protein [Shewanella sp. Isolate13]MCG9729591.1 winged helix-turn-helix domain-containing protein [Shewanella sp. Isolate13]
MNQNIIQLKLRDYTARDDVHGNQEGKMVYRSLLDAVESYPDVKLFEISLAGISRTDASFPRESVVALAKQFRGEKGFFLTGISIEDRDFIDNWHYAALIKKQPLTVWFKEGFRTLGPELSSAMAEILSSILAKSETTTSEVAKLFNLTAPNASSKLKKLANDGYILRVERIAPSGGMEFVYCPIK